MDQNMENTTASTKTEVDVKSIRDTDIIPVKSLVPNVYYTCSKTGDAFIWAEEGDFQDLTFAQLKVMKNRASGYFSKGWLYPQSDAVRKKLNIESCYKNKFNPRKDVQLLSGSDVNAVKERIAFLAPNEKSAFKDKVIKAVKDGKIENIKIIRLLEKELEVELMDLI